MNPSFNPAHASQTVDASLATRLDPVFQRFQFGGNYTTVEYPADSSAASSFNSLSRKLNYLFKMSDDETPNIAHNASGNIADNGRSGQQRTSDENARRRNIDLNRWHVKFDGSGKGLTVESFVFRVERLRQQQQISYEELFAEFHCLVTAELLNQFKTADSDYELIREIMERKQQHAESFEDYYAEKHDLTFRLRRKIPESEMIKIMKSNVKPSLATLIFATKVESVGELKAECKRAEKLLKESRSRPKYISEIGQEGENGDGLYREAVEALMPRHGPSSDRQRGNDGTMKHDKRRINTCNTNKHTNERHHLQPATSRAGQLKQEATAAIVTPQHHTTTPAPAIAVRAAQSIAFCQSPFHLMICYVCGMPGDFFLRNPAEGTRENRQVSLPQHGLFRMRQK
ncbi:hypothetical protein GQX74_014903 [Glossina fuscipes]|nr:hypothetical protein GQX74_014903 [Glossina fuscipes]